MSKTKAAKEFMNIWGYGYSESSDDFKFWEDIEDMMEQFVQEKLKEEREKMMEILTSTVWKTEAYNKALNYVESNLNQNNEQD